MAVAEVQNVIASILSGANTGNSTVGVEIARLVFLTRAWSAKSLTLRVEGNEAATIRNIDKWLIDFENMFRTNMVNIDVLSGYGGWLSAQGAVGGITSKEIYLQSYKSTVLAFAQKDFTKARVLRAGLQIRWKDTNKVNSFYDAFDDFIKESQALGIGTRERVSKFLNSKQGLEMVSLEARDAAGKITRVYKPESYASMYSRTRSREMEDVIARKEAKELGLDVIQINDVNTTTPICLQFENKYFSLEGKTPGLPILKIFPGFHPNCKHRILILGEPPTIGEMQGVNGTVNVETKKASASWTKGEKRTVKKQEKWNRENRV